MKTCFVVHDHRTAIALRECIGPSHVVVTPGANLNGARLERLVMVDEPTARDLMDRQMNWPRYEAWLRDIVAIRLAADAHLINVPLWATPRIKS